MIAKRTSALLFLLALTSPLLGADPKTFPLWESGAPGAKGKEPKDVPNGILYLSERKGGPTGGLVICPGGGYGHLAMDHEGRQIAAWANQLGMTALICDYRHNGKGYQHPHPLEDAQRAIRLMRANAKEWNVDPAKIGIIGFSAGGHLVSTVLTHFDEGNKNLKTKLQPFRVVLISGSSAIPSSVWGRPTRTKGAKKICWARMHRTNSFEACRTNTM